MNKVYAKLPDELSSNAIFEQLNPVQYQGNLYYGWKKTYIKTVGSQSEGTLKTLIDESKNIEYDDLTQSLIDNKNSKNANAQLLAQYAKSQINNATLVSQNAKQQLINAQLLTEIAKLKGSTK